ncbi:hypothetical protein [Litchfieldella rifensis]|uniref:Uncharacterized protein n=1 Tax=Litchfieldella rifensis TaxID=762643 RepID=A0ABV7LU69_9GAMM
MRQFLFPRRPLPRRTLLFCHLVIQVGLLVAGGGWLASRTPWLSSQDWASAWPELVLGGSLLLLAIVATRLLAELWLLPHHLAEQRPGFAPSAVVTRSFDRRPAIHDEGHAWTSAARSVDAEDTVLGSARVSQPAPSRRRGLDEPTLDLAASGTPEPPARHEPRL